MLVVLIKGIKRQSPRHEIKSAPWPGTVPDNPQDRTPVSERITQKKMKQSKNEMPDKLKDNPILILWIFVFEIEQKFMGNINITQIDYPRRKFSCRIAFARI
jgi:hypothetical protein